MHRNTVVTIQWNPLWSRMFGTKGVAQTNDNCSWLPFMAARYFHYAQKYAFVYLQSCTLG